MMGNDLERNLLNDFGALLEAAAAAKGAAGGARAEVLIEGDLFVADLSAGASTTLFGNLDMDPSATDAISAEVAAAEGLCTEAASADATDRSGVEGESGGPLRR